jgi:hypothetical protein
MIDENDHISFSMSMSLSLSFSMSMSVSKSIRIDLSMPTMINPPKSEQNDEATQAPSVDYEMAKTTAPNITNVPEFLYTKSPTVNTTLVKEEWTVQKRSVLKRPILDAIVIGAITVALILLAWISRLLRYKTMQKSNPYLYKHLDDSKTVCSERTCTDESAIHVS